MDSLYRTKSALQISQLTFACLSAEARQRAGSIVDYMARAGYRFPFLEISHSQAFPAYTHISRAGYSSVLVLSSNCKLRALRRIGNFALGAEQMRGFSPFRDILAILRVR